jgi:hypothetical protein
MDATRKERQMNTLRRKIYFGLATLAIAAASLGLGADSKATARKVNEYEGQHVAKKGSFDITGKYLAKKGSFDITESKGQPLAKKGSFDIT